MKNRNDRWSWYLLVQTGRTNNSPCPILCGRWVHRFHLFRARYLLVLDVASLSLWWPVLVHESEPVPDLVAATWADRDWLNALCPALRQSQKLLVSYVSIEWNEPNEPSLMLLFNKGKLLVLLLGGSGRRCMKCILCRCGSLSNGGRGALLGGGAGDGGGGGCCCCCWWLFNMGERCKSLRSIGRSKVCVNMAKLKHLTVKMNEQNNLPWKRHLHWRLNSSDAALVARRRDL